MACKGFLCPANNKRVSFRDCITRCTDRCMSRRTAAIYEKYSSKVRDGKSITQLLCPTRQQFLIQTSDYYESPFSFVDRTIGLLGHELTDVRIGEGLSEMNMDIVIDNETIHGRFDSFEGGSLWDLKITGAYKIKMGKADIRNLHDWTVQQNFYRLLIEHNLHTKVKNMYIETWAKEPQGILKRMKLTKVNIFKLPRLSDWLILKYIEIKRKRLKDALAKGMYSKCKYKYLWGGKRCNYCAVKEFCDEIEKENKTKTPTTST